MINASESQTSQAILDYRHALIFAENIMREFKGGMGMKDIAKKHCISSYDVEEVLRSIIRIKPA